MFFLLFPLFNVRGYVSLEKYKSQVKAVEVAVNSKEENFKTFVWISSKNSASVKGEIGRINNNKLASSAYGGQSAFIFNGAIPWARSREEIRIKKTGFCQVYSLCTAMWHSVTEKLSIFAKERYSFNLLQLCFSVCTLNIRRVLVPREKIHHWTGYIFDISMNSSIFMYITSSR